MKANVFDKSRKNAIVNTDRNVLASKQTQTQRLISAHATTGTMSKNAKELPHLDMLAAVKDQRIPKHIAATINLRLIIRKNVAIYRSGERFRQVKEERDRQHGQKCSNEQTNADTEAHKRARDDRNNEQKRERTPPPRRVINVIMGGLQTCKDSVRSIKEYEPDKLLLTPMMGFASGHSLIELESSSKVGDIRLGLNLGRWYLLDGRFGRFGEALVEPWISRPQQHPIIKSATNHPDAPQESRLAAVKDLRMPKHIAATINLRLIIQKNVTIYRSGC
ncbi:hypothetical protein F2Q68_00003311 [Brassica cretica]|uniref:Uncharacterized protein n=1 Tax=Brassica cretica TaxID=69181 RepID=A0A8S9J9L8_BRACR|nr:hypothetical protein F2Q68_00003311 [Brassica cretica]